MTDTPQPPISLASLTTLPQADGEPVFAEPWQARAFAITLQLYENGHFTWQEWADQLGAEIAASTSDDYYQQWLAALEKITHSKGLLLDDELTTRCDKLT